MGCGLGKYLLGLLGIQDGFSLTLIHFHSTMFSPDSKEISPQTNLTTLAMTSLQTTTGSITPKTPKKSKPFMDSCQDGSK